MPKVIKCVDGECLSSIAARNGMPDYHFLYGHSLNSALKTARPNPNCLVVDDEVHIPDAEHTIMDKPAGAKHKLTYKADKALSLRLLILGPNSKPMSGRKFEFTGAIGMKDTLGKDGLIKVVVKPGDRSAKLAVYPPSPPAKAFPPKPPASASSTSPAYPPAIDPTEFTDTPAPGPTPSPEMTWDLSIGSLPSHNTLAGVQARLANLGFPCKVGDSEEITRSSVKAFQKILGKTETGAFADIRDELKRAHDDP